MPINASGAHAGLIPDANETNCHAMLDGTQNYGGGILDAQVGSAYSGRRTISVRQHLASRSAQRQFIYDAALWYGAIRFPAEDWHRPFLLRAFGVLFYGGLLVFKGEGSWSHWVDEDIPIVSAVSHTARVTIQLGTTGSESAGFWAWLWGDHAAVTRAAATHGIGYLPRRETIRADGKTYYKYVQEVKGNEGGVTHYGVNVALGGQDYKNPVSGKVIRGNGKHGHFYLAYKAPTRTQNGVVLMATEQSAPLDSYTPHDAGSVWTGLKRAGMFFKSLATLGVPDQYGGYHGFGGHSRFSATGGDDWTKDMLAGVGPQRYYDGMFIDLSQSFDNIRVHANRFDIDQIGYSGQLL